MSLPLNGEKTHPLSDHARGVLAQLRHQAIPYSEINAGVIDRLDRENLIEIVMLPSPFKAHKQRLIRHVQLTDAGRQVAGETT